MQDALRDIFGPMFEAMFQGGMNSYLGYDKNDHGCKETANRRNGYTHETISNITDQVIEAANEWQNRPLKKFYTFFFVDCLYVTDLKFNTPAEELQYQRTSRITLMNGLLICYQYLKEYDMLLLYEAYRNGEELPFDWTSYNKYGGRLRPPKKIKLIYTLYFLVQKSEYPLHSSKRYAKV